MRVVVDANVLCAALLSRGKTADLLFSPKLKPIAPETLFTEVEKHKADLTARSKLSSEEVDELLALFKRHITIIPSEEFRDCFQEAKILLQEHTKDTEYVALALKMRCPLWSKEKRLKKIAAITTLDADEVEQQLFSSP